MEILAEGSLADQQVSPPRCTDEETEAPRIERCQRIHAEGSWRNPGETQAQGTVPTTTAPGGPPHRQQSSTRFYWRPLCESPIFLLPVFLPLPCTTAPPESLCSLPYLSTVLSSPVRSLCGLFSSFPATGSCWPPACEHTESGWEGAGGSLPEPGVWAAMGPALRQPPMRPKSRLYSAFPSPFSSLSPPLGTSSFGLCSLRLRHSGQIFS